MSDEPQLGGVYEPEVEEGQPSQPAQEQPRYVTAEDLDGKLDEFSEKLFRKLQSLTDKSESRVKKELDAAYRKELLQRAEEMRDAGHTVTDADIQAVLEQRKRELLASGLDEQPAQVGLSPVDRETRDSVNLELARLQRMYGVVPDPSDQEFRGWDKIFSNPDPKAFLADYTKRIEMLAKRLGKAPVQEQPVEPPAPGARLAVGGQAAPGGLDALTIELDQLQRKPNRTAAEEARRKELAEAIMKLLPRR